MAQENCSAGCRWRDSHWSCLGLSGFNLIDIHEPSTKLISQVGFALVMMLVGSHIQVRQTFGSKNLVAALRNIAISVVMALLLLGLASLAQSFGVSVMIAGFALGLAIAANGVPHRLAKQLFAVTEGLFAPVFYVSLGAAIDFRSVFGDSRLILLAIMLVAFGLLSHLGGMAFGQSFSQAGLSASALGIPTAIVSIGLTSNAISSGEGAAITLAMLLSVIPIALIAVYYRDEIERPFKPKRMARTVGTFEALGIFLGVVELAAYVISDRVHNSDDFPTISYLISPTLEFGWVRF